MSQEVPIGKFVCLASFAMDCSAMEFFKKVLALLMTTVTNVLSSIPQKFCYSHLLSWPQISSATFPDIKLQLKVAKDIPDDFWYKKKSSE